MEVIREASPAPIYAPAAAVALRGLTRARLIWAASLGALVFTAVACTTSRLMMLDTFASLVAGRDIAQHGLPRTETITWAGHGRPWIDQQWLAQWIYYQAYHLGGYPAVGGLSALLIGVSFGILAGYLLYRGTSPVRTLIWVAVAYGVCELNTVVRTQSFAYPLFVATVVILLEDDRERRFSRMLMAIPPIFLLWANLHGSVLLAAPLVVAYCIWAALHNLGAARRRAMVGYLLLAACMPLAVFATPYGFSIMDYYRSVLGNPVLTGRVAEWQAATFSGPSTQFVIVLLATVATIGFGYGRGYRPQLFMVAITCALAAAGVHAVRYQVWFAFAATILIADVMNGTFGATDTPIVQRIASRVVPALAVAGLLGSTLLLLVTPTSRYEVLSPRPAMNAAAQWAAAHPDAKIMAGDVSADALLWTHPELIGRVGFDSRYEVYSQTELELYTNWVADMGVRSQWAADLNGYDEVILSRVYREGDIKRMHLLPDWKQIYSDANGVVFVRTSAS